MGQLQQIYPAPDVNRRRQESLRTTLWFVPAVLVAVATLAFLGTYLLDQAVYRGTLARPWWIRAGSADAGRQVLTAIAAAVITVVGVVFSITILALTLASQQFGPRMLRNFIRDRGTQFTLGAFVATFVYAALSLGSIANGPRGEFVPHISIAVALLLMVADMLVLILHPSHGEVDPAAGGHRGHRPRPEPVHRRRVPGCRFPRGRSPARCGGAGRADPR